MNLFEPFYCSPRFPLCCYPIQDIKISPVQIFFFTFLILHVYTNSSLQKKIVCVIWDGHSLVCISSTSIQSTTSCISSSQFEEANASLRHGLYKYTLTIAAYQQHNRQHHKGMRVQYLFKTSMIT